MRASCLALAFAAPCALAAPSIEADTPVKVEPNAIDIIGGDFGLTNNAWTVEMWNTFSGMLAGMAGSSDPSASVDSTVGLLGLLGKNFETIAASFGPELVRWLFESAHIWAYGTPESEPTTVICSLWEYPSVLLSGLLSYPGPPARKGDSCKLTTDGGTGPYKANKTVDSNSPWRTIYHPLTKPNVSMPIVAWTGCIASGNLYNNVLTEIASHGYLVVVTGPPDGIMGSTVVSQTTKNIDWATSHHTRKYGDIDINNVIVAGHMCGGLEALSASYKDPRVKLTMLFNSGIEDAAKRTRLGELKAPVAYFYGGSTDRAYGFVSCRYSYPIDSNNIRHNRTSTRCLQMFQFCQPQCPTQAPLGRFSSNTEADKQKRRSISSSGRSEARNISRGIFAPQPERSRMRRLNGHLRWPVKDGPLRRSI
jgi:hypothetical protein